MYAGNHIKTCTPQLALEVGLNLRDGDRREIEDTTGLSAAAAILESYMVSAFAVYFTNPHGKAVGVAGVTPDNRIWMLCTDGGDEFPHTFIREAKRWVDSLPNPYLWNHADMRNEQHIKLLKLLKFTFLRYYVMNGVPLIQFIKPCANPLVRLQ